MSIPRFFLSQLASLLLAGLVGAASGDEPTLEQRLEKLAETLEAEREKNHIPGLSIAIVKDDEIIWARGFGLADVEAKRPADPSWIYLDDATYNTDQRYFTCKFFNHDFPFGSNEVVDMFAGGNFSRFTIFALVDAHEPEE